MQIRTELVCVECGISSEKSSKGWRAYLTDDEPAEAPATAAPEAPSEQAIPDTRTRVFQYLTPDGDSETIGTWTPAARDDSTGVVKAVVSVTADPETAARWRAELAAGKLPQTNENDP